MKDNELKPCPFCGGEAHIDRMGTGRASMSISCEDCGTNMETGETWIDENSHWNQRVTDAPKSEKVTYHYSVIASVLSARKESRVSGIVHLDSAIEASEDYNDLCDYIAKEFNLNINTLTMTSLNRLN